jgi:hypothetical protein
MRLSRTSCSQGTPVPWSTTPSKAKRITRILAGRSSAKFMKYVLLKIVSWIACELRAF